MIKTYNFSSGGSPAHNGSSNTTLMGISRQDAFACLYDAYADRIRRIVLFRVADEKLAQEITADVFLEAWEQLPAYRTGKAPIITWLYSITQQAMNEYYRTRESSIPLPPIDTAEISTEAGLGKQLQLRTMSLQPDKDMYEAGVGETLSLQVLSPQLAEGLRELADQQQQTLILGFIGELSASEIALQLEKQHEAALASQISGLRGLVRYLSPKDDEPTPLIQAQNLPVMV